MLHSQHSKSNSPAVLRRALGFFSFFFGLVLIAAMALLGPPSSSSAASKLSEKTNVRISNRGGGSASVNPGQFAEKLGLTLSSAATVPPATITVDRTDDVPAAAACTVAPNDCSLRGAIAFANLNPGTTINIPAGTYNLTISGAGEGFSGNNAIGDLDITANNTTIVGAGAASTIINQTTAGDRVIEVNPFLDPGFVTSISGVTISGGTESTGVGGGGIVSGAIGNTLTLTNCIVSGNSATGAGSFGGGGISHAGGNLVINGCTFTNNSTSASGGAVGYSAGDPFGRFPSVGTLTISGSSFSNNTSTSTAIGGGALDLFDFNRGTSTFQIDSSGFSNNSASSAAGGAIIVESGGPLTVSTSSFENNHAGTRGGAVYGSGTAGVVRFSRLAGNNVTTPTNGNTIFFATGTFTADDNWWGVNTGPSSNDFRNPSGSVSPTTFLQLRASASPNSICTGATSSISADIKQRNAGAPLTVELNGLPPFPATFVNATPSLGSLSAVSANFVDGAASATFTAGATAGTANIDVTADNQTVTASITVQTNTTTDPADQTVCQGGTATFSTTGSGPGPITFTWKKGATVLNNGDLGGRVSITSSGNTSTLSISNVAASDADTYTVDATGACNTATQSATLTVNIPTSATAPTDQTVCQGATANFSTTASGTGPFHYAWTVDGSPFDGDNSSISVPTGSVSVGNHPVSVTVTGACGSDTKSATLTVQENTSATTPSDQTVCQGASANFSTTASGTGPFHYAWTLDGSPFDGDSSSISVNTGSLSVGGHAVSVTVSGTCGSVTKNATLTVQENTSATTPANQTVCPGVTANFSTTASGTGPFHYAWTVDGSPFNGDSASISVPTGSMSSGNHPVTVTVSGTCGSVTKSATLTVQATTATSDPPDQTVCVGATVSFTTNASGTGPFSFVWKKGAMVLTSGGRISITNGPTSSTLTITNVQSSDAGTYTVETTGACNTATQSANLAIDSTPPTITCPSNIVTEPTCPSGAVVTYQAPVGMDSCPGAVTTRTAGLASGSVFPIGTTTVTYTVTDSTGQSASCSFTVTVKTAAATIQDLINQVQALMNQGALNQTNGQSLITRLQSALDYLNNGKIDKACDKLADFIQKTQNFIATGALTSAQGQPLIDSANHVRNTIGCNGTSGTCT
jgi:predicted outer membrane repeat protein